MKLDKGDTKIFKRLTPTVADKKAAKQASSGSFYNIKEVDGNTLATVQDHVGMRLGNHSKHHPLILIGPEAKQALIYMDQTAKLFCDAFAPKTDLDKHVGYDPALIASPELKAAEQEEGLVHTKESFLKIMNGNNSNAILDLFKEADYLVDILEASGRSGALEITKKFINSRRSLYPQGFKSLEDISNFIKGPNNTDLKLLKRFIELTTRSGRDLLDIHKSLLAEIGLILKDFGSEYSGQIVKAVKELRKAKNSSFSSEDLLRKAGLVLDSGIAKVLEKTFSFNNGNKQTGEKVDNKVAKVKVAKTTAKARVLSPEKLREAKIAQVLKVFNIGTTAELVEEFFHAIGVRTPSVKNMAKSIVESAENNSIETIEGIWSSQKYFKNFGRVTFDRIVSYLEDIEKPLIKLDGFSI